MPRQRHIDPIVLRVAARWRRRTGTDVDIRTLEITTENLEEVLGSLVDGIDDVDILEKTTGLDLRSLAGLLKGLPHNDDLFHNGESIFQHMQWVLADLEELSKTKDAATQQILKIVALLHDLGKAFTHEVQPDGRNTFKGHAEKSVQIAEALLAKQREQLGVLYQRILDLVRFHDVFLNLANSRKQQTGGGVGYLKRFLRENLVIEGHLDTLLTFAKADSARAKAESGSLQSLQGVMEDIERAEAKNLEQSRAKERMLARLHANLPQLKAFLAEVPEAADALPDLSKANEILGRTHHWELAQELRKFLTQ
jgi:putative nucleotidyltransferase with HDIG domain